MTLIRNENENFYPLTNIEKENLVSKKGVFIGKMVEWLRGNDRDSKILFVFKRAITFLLSILLVGSILGVPFFNAGVIEWRKQLINVVKLVKGTQGLCNGDTQKKRVQEIFNQLEKDQPIGIKYNKSGIKGSVKDGNCSSMSLDFAHEYLKMKREHEITEHIPLKSLVDRIKIFAERYNFPQWERNALVQEFMNRQEAFNCIEVDRSQKGVDFSLAKVQSIANVHFFKISHSSSEFTYNDDNPKNTKNILAQEISNLPTGVHLLRSIISSDNNKLEERGHTMIFIKEEQGTFFYDPNFGVDLIKGDVIAEIFDVLKQNYRLFKVRQTRFYTLEEKVGISAIEYITSRICRVFRWGLDTTKVELKTVYAL
ncbi:MAG: hypothetical protein K1000chlam2_01765 [Chlamydiae bacterium]|nr:hypothetical protein [Chlamydiota bacterium]